MPESSPDWQGCVGIAAGPSTTGAPASAAAGEGAGDAVGDVCPPSGEAAASGEGEGLLLPPPLLDGDGRGVPVSPVLSAGGEGASPPPDPPSPLPSGGGDSPTACKRRLAMTPACISGRRKLILGACNLSGCCRKAEVHGANARSPAANHHAARCLRRAAQRPTAGDAHPGGGRPFRGC